ncbi:MAG: HypC/HybG/HupF family hydrogenase formation chaperone [Pirellulales bacterium]|nr:HypC/HybG/HupF family hydrogenase formation chaperone [Pirellulales bacterium]
MCLAVPGKVVEWIEQEPPFPRAMVEFGGVRREIYMACLPDAAIGDYVIVHAGIAISRMDTEEANQVFELLKNESELFFNEDGAEKGQEPSSGRTIDFPNGSEREEP